MNAHDAQELPNLCDKILGCIVGAAVGDALGAPNEFDKTRNGYAKLNANYTGKWTDDTQLSLLALEALKASHNMPLPDDICTDDLFTRYRTAMSIALANWVDHPLGGHRAPGAACIKAGDAYSHGLTPETWAPRSDALGSGAIMRAHVHGAVLPPKRAYRMAEADSLLTHGPRAAKAAGRWATVISSIIRCPAPHLLRDSIETYAGHKESADLFDWYEGWESTKAGKVCEMLFFKSNKAWPLVFLAAGSTGDSDTLGSMMGAAIGGAYGLSQIPARLVNKIENPDVIFKAGWDACALATFTSTSRKHWELW